MLDAISFEDTGKPAVVVATTHFMQQASSLKKSMNLEGLPLVAVPHPLGAQEVAASKAQSAAAMIVKSLTH